MACAGCSSGDLRRVASLGEGDLPTLAARSAGTLWRCHECGLAQVLPRPQPEDLREHYRTEYLHRAETRTRLSTGRRRLFEHSLRLLESETWGRRLLDVGCGEGEFVALASERGWTAVGLELHRGAAEAGAARGVRIVEGGPEALPPGRYDAITLWNVLDQMPEPGREIRQLLPLLEPAGVLFVRVPNLLFHLGAWRAWRLLFRGRRAPTVFHPLVFDGPGLARFLTAAGLTEVEVRNSALTESPIPGLPGGLAALLRPLSSGLAALLAALTGGRLLVAPSLVAWARPPADQSAISGESVPGSPNLRRHT